MPTVGKNKPRIRQVQARAEETRERLVDAAVRLFSERGYEGVTLRDIAVSAGRPASAITYHFASKDELWREAAAQLHQNIEDYFAKRIDGLEGVDAETCAKLVLKDYVLYFARNPQMFRFMVHLGFAPSERLSWYASHFGQPFREQFGRVFEEVARQRGITRPDTRYTLLLYAFIGSAGLVYALAPEVQATTGVDPMQASVIESHIEIILEIFLPQMVKQEAV